MDLEDLVQLGEIDADFLAGVCKVTLETRPSGKGHDGDAASVADLDHSSDFLSGLWKEDECRGFRGGCGMGGPLGAGVPIDLVPSIRTMALAYDRRKFFTGRFKVSYRYILRR